jgi:hypothetical protein
VAVSFIATTTVTLLGGVGVDRFADPIDTDEIKMEGVPASILEGGMTSRSRPADGRTDQVRSYTLRVYPNVDLKKYNRVRDERTGDVYTLDTITKPVNPVGHRSYSAVLRRVT